MPIITEDTARYVLAVAERLRAIPDERKVTWCPECGGDVEYFATMDHIVLDTTDHTPDAAHTFVLVVACEGYWVIPPSLVGIDSPGWQDWLAPASVPCGQCSYSLNRDERRDLDACPSCGWLIPYGVKLDERNQIVYG